MNYLKRTWGHYLALMILIVLLSLPIHLVFIFIQSAFGREAGLIALTITVITVVVFIVRGAVHAHRLARNLQRDLALRRETLFHPNILTSLIFKIFRIDPCVKVDPKHPIENISSPTEIIPQLFKDPARKHRGKPPRFPKEKIRKAVLKWESRDPSFATLTLEEFLAQEFGSGPDGILLMATTTFYDWRRRILKEIESHEHQP